MPESACEDLEDRRKYGWLFGVDANDPLEFVDPRGTDDPGIAVHRHPEMLLVEHRELRGIVDRFQTGAIRKLRESHYATLSHFETECLLVMMAARAREEQRSLERQRDKVKRE